MEMLGTMRYAVVAAVAVVLSGCAAAPERPDAVDVRTNSLSTKDRYSAIEARVQNSNSEAESSFAASLKPSVETLTRLNSSYTQALDESNELRLGDAVSTSGMWGNSVRYGGVQFGTVSDTRSNVMNSETLATSGVAVLPTAADALFASINRSDALLRQNLAIDSAVKVSGTNSLNFVARDSLGRSQSITAPMIEAARLVQSGCADFNVGVGKAREDYAVTSNEYGPLFANTTVACAAPLGFTIEGHGEYLADEVAALGLGAARQVGMLGTASVAVASSKTESGAGWLARVGFEHQNQWFNVMVRSRVQSREFRDVGSALTIDPVMQRNLASIGLNVTSSSTLAIAYASQTTWSQERSNLISLSQSMSLGRGSVSMSAGHSLVDSVGSSMFLSYKRPFGAAPARSPVQEFDLSLLDLQRLN
jgi:outer membrane usher protein